MTKEDYCRTFIDELLEDELTVLVMMVEHGAMREQMDDWKIRIEKTQSVDAFFTQQYPRLSRSVK